MTSTELFVCELIEQLRNRTYDEISIDDVLDSLKASRKYRLYSKVAHKAAARDIGFIRECIELLEKAKKNPGLAQMFITGKEPIEKAIDAPVEKKKEIMTSNRMLELYPDE